MAASTQQKVHDVVKQYRPARQFPGSARSEGHESRVTSLDFDDTGEFLVAASDDETMHVYDIKEGKRTKTIPSKKYGIHLARFTHHSRNVLFASTKQDDSLRLLELHNESFVRYFTGHTGQVTCIALSPGNDQFLSCGNDDMVCLWDLNSRSPQGKLKLVTPYLAAYDPSAQIMAIASQSTSSILLYDVRNFDKAPFATFDMFEAEDRYTPTTKGRAWTKLEFSNDGKNMLLGTDYHGHFVLDAFDGAVKSFLVGKTAGSGRAAPVSTSGKPLGQGDVCFTQDGRYVVGGTGESDLLVWDTQNSSEVRLEPITRLASQGIKAPVVQCNPRFNMLVTADTRTWHVLPIPPIRAASRLFAPQHHVSVSTTTDLLRKIIGIAVLDPGRGLSCQETRLLDAMEKVDEPIHSDTLVHLFTNIQSRAESLISEFRDYQALLKLHKKQQEVEIRAFKVGVESEVKVLNKISRVLALSDEAVNNRSCDNDLQHGESPQLHALKSSNMPFYEAVWDIVKSCRRITALSKKMYFVRGDSSTPPHVVEKRGADGMVLGSDLEKKGVLVDIVADNGLEWIKVSTLTEKRLLFEMAKQGWERYGGCDESDVDDDDDDDEVRDAGHSSGKLELVQLAEDLRLASRQSRINFRHPQIRFVLPRIREGVLEDVDSFLADLRATGALVQCHGEIGKNLAEHGLDLDKLMPSAETTPLTSTINIDCTILLALASDISHLSRHQLSSDPIGKSQTYHRAIMNQIGSEEATPILPGELYPILTGRSLQCTSHAAQRMREIVDCMGTASEKMRADILLGDGMYKDQPSWVLRRALGEQSMHGIPEDLQLPVKVITFDVEALLSSGSDLSVEAVARFPVDMAAHVRAKLDLTPINASVFLYGWACQYTTLTSNRTIATGLVKAINDMLDSQESEMGHESDFIAPLVYTCETARSLIGKVKLR